MKIAFHVDQLSAKVPGGMGTYITHLVPALAELPDTDLMLFHSRGEGAGLPDEWRRDFPVVELPQSARSLYPRWALLGSPKLPPPLAGADVVHAPLPAAIPPVSTGQRLIVTVHDLAFEAYPEMFPVKWRWLYRRGLRAAASRASTIITPSQSTADDLARHAPHPRVVVIPEAPALPRTTDIDSIELLGRLAIPAPFILAVGTVEPRKNLVTLIRAYRRVLEANDLSTTLVIAGPDGWRAEEIHQEAERSGPGRVIFTGRLDAADLDALYRVAWCAAYLSSFEGFGLPVLDAMQRGIPIVCSDVSSIPEVAGDAALLVDPHDEQQIADNMERILVSEATAASLSAKGLKQAAGFTWEKAARATRAAYEA